MCWRSCAPTFLSIPLALGAREREPNSRLCRAPRAPSREADAPVVIFGYTGKENSSPSYVFNQEANFYYLTGHNEEGAALLLLPPSAAEKGWKGPQRDSLPAAARPPRRALERRAHGPGRSRHRGENGLCSGRRTTLSSRVGWQKSRRATTTSIPSLPHGDDTGYPHARESSDWLKQECARSSRCKTPTAAIGAMRQIKSPGEIALLHQSHRPLHRRATCRHAPGPSRSLRISGGRENGRDPRRGRLRRPKPMRPSSAPGFHSTVLHFNELDAQIKDGDVVLMDVGGQYSGYTADITRTIPANGHFTPRQREIYEIVLGAQNAALAALKPGMTPGRPRLNSLFQIAYDYINTHGTDREGQPLGSTSSTAWAITSASKSMTLATPTARSNPAWSSPSSPASISRKKTSACASRTTF